MVKVVGLAIELSAKRLFRLGKYLLKIWFENSLSAIQHIGNRYKFLEPRPHTPLTKLILVHTFVVLHYTHHNIKNDILGQRWEGSQNTQNKLL